MAGKYTISRFAKETGLHVKTISHWIAVRRNVFEKLPLNKVNRVSFTKLSHVNAISGPNVSEQELMEAYDKIINVDGFDAKVKRQLADIRSLCTNFVSNNAVDKCNEDTLQEVLFYTTSINREIYSKFPGLLPKSHGIASLRLFKTSAARALDVPRHCGEKTGVISTALGDIKITPKDRDIAQFIKKHNGFVRPVDIAKAMRKTNNATAWVCRSVEKLTAAGILERNSKGHYKFK